MSQQISSARIVDNPHVALSFGSSIPHRRHLRVDEVYLAENELVEELHAEFVNNQALRHGESVPRRCLHENGSWIVREVDTKHPQFFPQAFIHAPRYKERIFSRVSPPDSINYSTVPVFLHLVEVIDKKEHIWELIFGLSVALGVVKLVPIPEIRAIPEVVAHCN